VQESLAVANAVELLKLVFLSTAASENVQASVAATLQLYSESDIFTALTYLRDKNYMVSGFIL
jgi:general transcription factor 3C polypeptide 1